MSATACHVKLKVDIIALWVWSVLDALPIIVLDALNTNYGSIVDSTVESTLQGTIICY